MMLLVGLLPSKILDLTRASLDAAAPSSFRTSCSVLPNARALARVSLAHAREFVVTQTKLGIGRQSESEVRSWDSRSECHVDVLGLGEEVGQEDLVVLAAGDGVEGLNGGEEVAAECQHRLRDTSETVFPPSRL
jgi:hypothetical protein